MMSDLTWWQDDRDAPWWYNERASLSIFAGAVWSCQNGQCLEEYATRKADVTGRGRRRTKAGRGDLEFGVGSWEYVAEAKQAWPILGGKSVPEHVEECLRNARRDSSKTPDDELRRLGIAFVSPKLNVSKKDDLEGLLSDFVAYLDRDLNGAARAWAFPADRRHLSYNGYYYPGAVVLIRPPKITAEENSRRT
jgi:hypothetical protein